MLVAPGTTFGRQQMEAVQRNLFCLNSTPPASGSNGVSVRKDGPVVIPVLLLALQFLEDTIAAHHHVYWKPPGCSTCCRPSQWTYWWRIVLPEAWVQQARVRWRTGGGRRVANSGEDQPDQQDRVCRWSSVNELRRTRHGSTYCLSGI